MGVYLANNQYNKLTSIFKDIRLMGNDLITGDGLLYYIQSNPLEFIECNDNQLTSDRFNELTSLILQSPWLQDKEELISLLTELRNSQNFQRLKELGDRYFESKAFDRSLDYYIKIIEIFEEDRHSDSSPKDIIDQVYCRIGIILLTIGEVNEGLELIEHAYDINQSQEILLQLMKYKIEFNVIDDLTSVEDIVEDILNHAKDDGKLSFLVWYYHYIGDYESSVTSYMQIKDMTIRFKLVDYYMVYMLESKQSIAMESYLKPLKDFNEFKYLVELIKVYIRIECYEEALDIISNMKQDEDKSNIINIQKSICYLGLGRIIESVTGINLIDIESLVDEDRENYYVQLSKLSKFSKDFSKEHTYNQVLLRFWQKRYRKIYSGILHNTKWKVNK